MFFVVTYFALTYFFSTHPLNQLNPGQGLWKLLYVSSSYWARSGVRPGQVAGPL